MPLSEFDMINRYFRAVGTHRDDTILAIGDDAALIEPGTDQLVTVLSQWQAGIDYDRSTAAAHTARQILEHTMDKLEALSAQAAWMTLSLSLEQVDEAWLADFSDGLLGLARQHNIELIGGDTTRGAETVRLHLIGTAAVNQTA